MTGSERLRVAVPFNELVSTWESAYREYVSASDQVTDVATVTSAAAWGMTSTSSNVDRAWHAFSAARGLPWWAVAAAESAAEAFERLSREWEAKANNGEQENQAAQSNAGPANGNGPHGGEPWFEAPAGIASEGTRPGWPGDAGPARRVPSPVQRGRSGGRRSP